MSETLYSVLYEIFRESNILNKIEIFNHDIKIAAKPLRTNLKDPKILEVCFKLPLRKPLEEEFLESSIDLFKRDYSFLEAFYFDGHCTEKLTLIEISVNYISCYDRLNSIFQSNKTNGENNSPGDLYGNRIYCLFEKKEITNGNTKITNLALNFYRDGIGLVLSKPNFGLSFSELEILSGFVKREFGFKIPPNNYKINYIT